MTGRLLSKAPEILTHVSGKIDFEDGGSLWFQDVRKFGRITWYESVELFCKKTRIGIEPLSEDFTEIAFQHLLKQSHAKVKGFLLDQTKIAGLGNIYVDEALWSAELHPLTKTNEIGIEQVRVLREAIQTILRDSIASHGTTFLSFYFDGGKSGNYRKMLKVFGRTGEACLRCGTMILKIRVVQRGTHYCPSCQIGS